MLDDDGNICEVEPHEKFITKEHETTYLNTLSVNSIDTHIDALLSESNRNDVTSNPIYYSSAELEVHEMADKVKKLVPGI